MRRLSIVLVALLAAAAGWAGVWFYFAGQIEEQIAHWKADRQSEGLRVAHGPVTVSGFPFAWRVQIAQPDLADTFSPGWSWRGEAVVATISPWKRGEVPLEFPGEHFLATGTGAAARSVSARAERPEGWAWIDAAGQIAEVGLDLRGLEARLGPDTPPATAFRARVSLRPRSNKDPARADVTADVSLDLTDLTLPQPPPGGLGARVARAIADLSLKGRITHLPLPQAVAIWRDGGGTVEVPRATLVWGPLTIDANGTLALDALNRPIGAGTARVRGFSPTIDALVESGAVSARDGTAAKIALNLISRPVGEGLGRELEVPITAQDGQFYAAGFKLMPVRALRLE
jgi:hypothetical protein